MICAPAPALDVDGKRRRLLRMARALENDGTAPIALRTFALNARIALAGRGFSLADEQRLLVAFEGRRAEVRAVARLYR